MADIRKGRVKWNGAKGILTIRHAHESTNRSKVVMKTISPVLSKAPCLILQVSARKDLLFKNLKILNCVQIVYTWYFLLT